LFLLGSGFFGFPHAWRAGNLCSHSRLIQRMSVSALGSVSWAEHFGRDAGMKGSEVVMLSWVVTFLVIALIAGILGFGGVAGASIEIAKAIFFIAVILFIVSAVVGIARGRTRV
jgi:uncharacterized membrane protein YtjA (UPF0391 family)